LGPTFVAATGLVHTGSGRTLSAYEMSFVARGSQIAQPVDCTHYYLVFKCADGTVCPQKKTQPTCTGQAGFYCCTDPAVISRYCDAQKPWTGTGGTPGQTVGGCGTFIDNTVCDWNGLRCICDGGNVTQVACEQYTCDGATSNCNKILQ